MYYLCNIYRDYKKNKNCSLSFWKGKKSAHCPTIQFSELLIYKGKVEISALNCRQESRIYTKMEGQIGGGVVPLLWSR